MKKVAPCRLTVQGSSLERTVYLDRIGRKLGPDRWRISPDSFIAGCADKKQIEERTHKFKALIDPSPLLTGALFLEKPYAARDCLTKP
jgi:hypothetical protein